MNISRTIAIALVGLSLSLSATSANAGFLGDVVHDVVRGTSRASGLNNGMFEAAANARKQNQARIEAENDKSQFGWLGNKEYVACLKVDTARNCNLKTFGVEKITRR